MIKNLQFGTGRFIKGYWSWMVHQVNKGKTPYGEILMVKSTARPTKTGLNPTDLSFTVQIKGLENGLLVDHTELVTSIVNSCVASESLEKICEVFNEKEVNLITSNTTENGLLYDETATFEVPCSYSSRLTHILYRGYLAKKSGPIGILPLELIENNGAVLKANVERHSKEWGLETGFNLWLNAHVVFYNTLVDSITTGDSEAVIREPYYRLYLEGALPFSTFFPYEAQKLHIYQVDDLSEIRDIKIRVLNGLHTALIAMAYGGPYQTVVEAVSDQELQRALESLFLNEILPSLPYEKETVMAFHKDTLERFLNPYLEHKLSDIANNTVGKFYYRLVPSILAYESQYGQKPTQLMELFERMKALYQNGLIQEDSDLAKAFLKAEDFESYLELFQ